MIIDKPLQEFRNFKGLFSKREAGLVPSSNETGVFASEISNIVTDDGTITFAKGFTAENDGSTDTTWSETTTSASVAQTFSYKNMNADQRKLIWTSAGHLMIYNSVLNKYERFFTNTSSAGKIMGGTPYYLASSDIFDRNQFWFALKDMGGAQRWNSALTTFASATSNTITKQGAATWTAEGFRPTSSVMIENTAYAYTGGAGTTTLTGVTPDPSSAGHTVGAAIPQAVEQNQANFSAAPDPSANIVFVYNGRLGLASDRGSQLFLSSDADPADFTTTGVGGRVIINIGDGQGPITNVQVFRNQMAVFKEDAIISVEMEQDTSTTELTRIRVLVKRPRIGALNALSATTEEDSLFFISADKEFKLLSSVDQKNSAEIPKLTIISQSISPTLDNLEFNLMDILSTKEKILIACRKSSSTINDTVIEYDRVNKTFYFHDIPVSSFFMVGTDIFITDPNNLAVYKWKDGFDHDETAVERLWRGPRHTFGEEFRKKASALFAVHMRISTNTIVNCQVDYNHLGTLHSINWDINGDGSSSSRGEYIVSAPIGNPFGQNKYGIVPYGSDTKDDNDKDLIEIIAFKKIPLRFTPYDFTVQFSSSGQGQRAKILSYGFDVRAKGEVPKHSIVNN